MSPQTTGGEESAGLHLTGSRRTFHAIRKSYGLYAYVEISSLVVRDQYKLERSERSRR